MRKYILLVVALMLSLPMSAKLTQFIVRGNVVKQDYSKADWYRESVDSVMVALVMNDTIPVDFKMLSGDDDLKMTSTSELRILAQGGIGSYSLILNRDGFEPLRHDFKVVSEGQDVVNLRSLAMEPRRDNTLREVEVVGTAIKMVMKGDTIVYDSRAFKLAEGSTLDALIRQLPGAQLADDGSITVNGKKVTSLLLNGNDFFKGDPEVALRNLPAYTVDKIKVYDKESKDDYITLSSQTLSSSVEDENIVMDVTLKKEFAMATILSVEGGYGPGIFPKGSDRRLDSRYLGRAFAIGFGKNYHWGVYGGHNNINNTSAATSYQKDWGYGDNRASGDGTTSVGGLDFYFKPTKKVEISAYMSYTRRERTAENKSATTAFYDTGNLYKRDANTVNSLSDVISAGASVRYSGDKVSLYISPSMTWQRKNSDGITREANFNRNPFESYMGAAIDSLFSGRASQSLLSSVSSSTYSSYRYAPELKELAARISFDATWRPVKGRGLFRFSASGSDSRNSNLAGNLYCQPFVADPAEPRIHRQQWNDVKSQTDRFGANIRYEWDKKLIGDKWIKTFSLQPAVGWDVDRDFNDNIVMAQLLLDEIDVSDNPLPSVTAPENIRPLLSFDGNNTVRSLSLENDILARVNVGFNAELTAPTDSGFNPNLGISIRYDHRQYWRHYTMDKPYADPQFHYAINRSDPHESLGGDISLMSQNTLYNLNIRLSYVYRTTLRSLSMLAPTLSDSNPFEVYLGPETGENFPIPYLHALSFYTGYFNKKNHQNAYISASYQRDYNKLSHAAVFNPATGVTTHRPMSVNGNWNVYLRGAYRLPFGPNERWMADFASEYTHYNSVDYVSSVGAPEQSLVKTDEIQATVVLDYNLTNGTNFGVAATTKQWHSASPRPDFRAITAWESGVGGHIEFFLPWNIQGETKILGTFRRGYEDSSLNRTTWVWNASVRKSILKGAMTFKLDAVDILGQLSNISSRINAQGRTETWNNSLPRYVMFTVAYRFNFTPQALR